MTGRRWRSLRAATTLTFALASIAPAAAQTAAGGAAPQTRTVIIPGAPGAPTPPDQPKVRAGPTRHGDVMLSFPQVDVQAVAKAVLGDILGLKYSVDPSVHAVVTLETAEPIPKDQVLPLFEEALRTAGLSLVAHGGAYVIAPSATARGEATVLGPADFGFGEETIQLKFADAEELKKLLDPVVPGAITSADSSRNILIVTGTTTQRHNVRDLVEQFDVDWLKGMSFALYIPQRTDSRLIEPELDKLLNGPGAPTAGMVRLLTMEKINGILAISRQAQYLEDVRHWVEVLDREGDSNERRLYVYHVQNGRSADLAKVLIAAFGGGQVGAATTTPASTTPGGAPLTSGMLTPAPLSAPAPAPAPSQAGAGAVGSQVNADQMAATISSDETSNAVIVYATQREYAVIQDALNRLDVPPLQVLLDATITEVSLNNSLKYGIQWFLKTHNFTMGYSQGTQTGTDSSGNPIISGLPTQIFPGYSALIEGASITATINALSKVTTVHVISAPEVMVLNNHTASLQVGDEVPIVTGSSVSTLANANVVNNIEYKDTGVILNVTPRVNDGGLVLLDISQEVSQVDNNTTSGIDSPTIQQRKIATSVAVRDGQTIALGGLMQDSRSKGKQVVPIFGDIPVLGHLFGDNSNSIVRTELLVMLTPRVVRNTVDVEAITEEVRQKIRSLKPVTADRAASLKAVQPFSTRTQ
jgi:general secretion pathway protein D